MCQVVDDLEGVSMGLNVLTKIFVYLSILDPLRNDFQSLYPGMPVHHSMSISCKQICSKHHPRKIWERSTERRPKTGKDRFEEKKNPARYQLPGDLSRSKSHAYFPAISNGE